MKLQDLHTIANDFNAMHRLPMMFVGHGNPMNAILDNSFTKTWKEIGKQLPRPKAILSISAHWLTRYGTKVTAMEKPETIHDFGGFPKELFDQQYPAPGAPDFAKQTRRLIPSPEVSLDYDWGLDHGTWSVLLPMFPLADIPVYQLSIDYSKPPQFHYDLGKLLKSLRERGVLIIGSGNVVHNLSAMRLGEHPYDWALEFDDKIGEWISARNHQAIVDFQKLGTLASIAHPTHDHYLPLLYILGMQDKSDKLEFFNSEIDMGSVSMRSVLFR
jgi:4,5-DOPA dioxygenase extradiol